MVRSVARPTLFVAAFTAVLAAACSDDPAGSGPGDADASDMTSDAQIDGSDAPDPDVEADLGDLGGGSDLDTDALTDLGGDTDAGEERSYDFAVGPPFEGPSSDLLADLEVESCAVYRQTRCDDTGAVWTCEVFDAESEAFVDEVDPLFEKVLLFERWYDLYHQPDGQTAQRELTTPMAAGTEEAVWGDPANFRRYDGVGDAAIWTGVGLNAYLLRYLETGTEADYQRFETKVRQLVRLFDVTGIPGYLARFHFLLLEEGGPDTDAQIIRHGERGDHRNREIPDAESVDGLPSIYLSGLQDSEGTVWPGTPMWHGNPSIDQYTGPMVALPAAWSLLRDETLRDRVAEHLTCYLKRLQRIELINLQSNADALEAVQALLAGGVLDLDDDDIDFSELDTIVAYVHRQINDVNDRTFDTTCPETLSLEPWRVVDATSTTFILDLLDLFADLQSRDNERPNSIDHIYAPSVRGGDAMHLMHLAAMAWYFTGDDTYADFLQDELIGAIRADEVAQTMGSLVLPRWCRSFFGSHITVPPLWAFINLLEDSPLRDEMFSVFQREAWEKISANLGNAKFDMLYAGVVPAELAVDRQMAIERALTALADIGGNGGVEVDPRRNYSISYDEVVRALPEPIAPVCPSEDERARCEEGVSLLGLTIPGEDISFTCTAADNECTMEDGECTRVMASAALPVDLRVHSDFIWQRNPFEMGRTFGLEGIEQSPSLDVIEIFWLARHYGWTDAGEGQALAWRQTGACGD